MYQNMYFKSAMIGEFLWTEMAFRILYPHKMLSLVLERNCLAIRISILSLTNATTLMNFQIMFSPKSRLDFAVIFLEKAWGWGDLFTNYCAMSFKNLD